MAHIPIGYKFENGKPVVDVVNGEKVKKLFRLYLEGYSLREAGLAVGIDSWHCGIKRILSNRKYLGEGIYPRLIDDDTFNEASHEIYVRAASLGRLNKKSKKKETRIPVNFILESTECEIEDPIEKAEYLYSQIKEA